jgi:hypothetical protein
MKKNLQVPEIGFIGQLSLLQEKGLKERGNDIPGKRTNNHRCI